MLERSLSDIYYKLKLNFYRRLFKHFQGREASLTTVESYCVEAIYSLGEPTISEFADFVMVSQANAAYKVQSLIKKGYVRKEQSQTDRREFTLVLTEKFYQYYDMSQEYVLEVSKRIRERFTPEEVAAFEQMLQIVNTELMPEIGLQHPEQRLVP